MKTLKKGIALILVLCFVFCLAGCSEDYFDGFEPASLRIVDCINNKKYEATIEDSETVDKMWEKFKSLDIDVDTTGEMGTAYLYMCFYNEDESKLAIFTIYSNGACCLGEDFTTFYTVNDGLSAYVDLCDMVSAIGTVEITE